MKQEEDFEANLAGEDGQSEEAKRSWFKRIKKGILTSTAEKKETPEGLWSKCPECGYICTVTELRENLFVCPKCSHHHRIGRQLHHAHQPPHAIGSDASLRHAGVAAAIRALHEISLAGGRQTAKFGNQARRAPGI